MIVILAILGLLALLSYYKVAHRKVQNTQPLRNILSDEKVAEIIEEQ